jgi:enediyne biosynthesis protein E4
VPSLWKALLCIALATALIKLLLPARGATRENQFENIAPRSRFSYVTRNDYRGRKYFIQPMCGGVAVFDYDSDGRPDIFLTNGSELPSLKKTSPAFDNCLLRNRGDGAFEDRTAEAGLSGHNVGYSFGAAIGDYDNDGRPDVFLYATPAATRCTTTWAMEPLPTSPRRRA